MTGRRFDVAVVGAGPAGLSAALASAEAGWTTCLVGPLPDRSDGRTAALLGGSVALLERLGAWTALAPGAARLATLRIVDATGSLFRPPPTEFRADEIGLPEFGWNVENARLAAGLAEVARRASGLTWIEMLAAGSGPARPGTLRLADGEEIEADLVVAADGRGSALRRAAGIATREHRYPQSAFTTVLAHALPHGDASTEFHTRAGPMTLVPLPGRRSSLVWVTVPQHARRLAAAPDGEVARAVESAVGSLLGRMEVDGPRGAVPIASLSAERLTGERLALVGEAGHVLPPIGAQGLNMGFADIAALSRLLEGAFRSGSDPGSPALLSGYERARRADIRVRSLAVDGMNRALLSSFLPLDMLRGLGLGLLGGIGPLRRSVMRVAMPGGREPVSRGTAPARASRP